MRRKVGVHRGQEMSTVTRKIAREDMGMFLRIVGDEHAKEFRDVSPDTAGQLVENDHITFCMDCKVFHLNHGVTWEKLGVEIRSLVN